MRIFRKVAHLFCIVPKYYDLPFHEENLKGASPFFWKVVRTEVDRGLLEGGGRFRNAKSITDNVSQKKCIFIDFMHSVDVSAKLFAT